MDVIAVDGLSRRYGAREAVKDVSFNVREGEVFGFLGPNGAGKTTTISVLCTLLRPSGGTATVCGYDVLRRRGQVRRSIGLVFQEPTLDLYLTGEQNLRLHAYAYGVPAGIRRERTRQLLTLMELWDRRGDMVHSYSGGMKRRLEIVRGLLHHPRVLFLDEPTLGLDPQTRRLVWQQVLDLRAREGITVFVTTHYMDEAEHCDRIAVIDHGEIVALDTPDNLKTALGGDLVTLRAEDTDAAVRELRDCYGLAPRVQNGSISFAVADGEAFLPEFIRGSGQRLLSVSVRRPTLEDVFLSLTGHAIRGEAA